GYLHAGLVGDVVGTVVVDEAPRADHAAAQVGQQPPDLAGLAERDVPGAQEFTHGLRHHEASAAAQGGDRLPLEIAHGANLAPAVLPRQSSDTVTHRRSDRGSPARVVEFSTTRV